MSNLYLFYGENLPSLKQEIKLWRTKFLEKYPDSCNLIEIKPDNLSEKNFLKEIVQELSSQPFLGDKKLIIIYNLTSELFQTLKPRLDKIPESNLVVLAIENKLAKNSVFLSYFQKNPETTTIKDFAISTYQITQNAHKTLKTFQKTISTQNLNYLIQNLDKSESKIINELAKLSLYTEQSEISLIDIKTVVSFAPHLSIFEMIDNLSQKNTAKALANFNHLLHLGEDPIKIFYLIARQIKILLEVKSLQEAKKSANQIASTLKLPPFVVFKTLKVITKFSIQELSEMLSQALKIDLHLKTGKITHTKKDATNLILAIENLLFTKN